MSLNVYIAGKEISPLEKLLSNENFKKKLSFQDKSYNFTLKSKIEEKNISYHCNYLGTDNIDEIYNTLNKKKADSTNNSVVLTFLYKEKCINLLKQYVDNGEMNNMHPFFLFYSLGFNKKDIISNIHNYYKEEGCDANFQTSVHNISIVNSAEQINSELYKYYN